MRRAGVRGKVMEVMTSENTTRFKGARIFAIRVPIQKSLTKKHIVNSFQSNKGLCYFPIEE